MITFQEITFFAAFIAGLLSFFSPCILPLVPVYIAFISGVSLEREKTKANRFRAFIASLLFVLGFSAIFIALGATATSLGKWLFKNALIFSKIGGVLLVALGLYISGLISIPLLKREMRFKYGGKTGIIWAPVIGIVFAFGWSPCSGPILAGILALSALSETLGKGISLLSLYSLGLAIPFIVFAIAIDLFSALFERLKKYMQVINLISGKFLVLMGILLIFGGFDAVSSISEKGIYSIVIVLTIIAFIIAEIIIITRVKKELGDPFESLPRSIVWMFYLDLIILALFLAFSAINGETPLIE